MTSSNESIFRVTGLCAGNSAVTGEFPAQMAVTRKMLSFENQVWFNKDNLEGNVIFAVTTVAVDGLAPFIATVWHIQQPIVMMTSWNGNIFRVTGPLCGEFSGPGEFPEQRPVTHSFDVFFDLRLNKRLSKQSRGWWFDTLSHPLWPHCNGCTPFIYWTCTWKE